MFISYIYIGASGILGNVTKDQSFTVFDDGKAYFSRMAELQGYVDMQRGGIPFVCLYTPVIDPISFAQSPSMDLIEVREKHEKKISIFIQNPFLLVLK